MLGDFRTQTSEAIPCAVGWANESNVSYFEQILCFKVVEVIRHRETEL